MTGSRYIFLYNIKNNAEFDIGKRLFILFSNLMPHFFLILCLSFFTSTQAKESGIIVSSNVTRSEITIGDKITYRITVEYPDKGQIELPSVLGNLGSFEVKAFDAGQPEKSGAGMKRTWELILSTFTIGDYLIPPQVVEYTPANDTTKQVIHTEPIAIVVKRSSPETAKDIADITPLALIKTGMPLFWVLFLVLAAAGAVVLPWYYLKRKKRIAREPPPKPPYEEAVDFLNKLRGKTFPSQPTQKAFCFSLSEILRRYLSRRFLFDALESTTEEFLVKIHSTELTKAQKEMARQFCEKTDPVKFASLPLPVEEQPAVFKLVETLVDQTKPRIQEPDKKLGKKKA